MIFFAKAKLVLFQQPAPRMTPETEIRARIFFSSGMGADRSEGAVPTMHREA
jgi:hypothetical protein